MSISVEISAEIVPVGGVDGFKLSDSEILPFDEEIKEMYVIHPEESVAGTCEECASYAGKIYSANEGAFPPIHANCRCERVPIMKTYNPITGDWNIPKGTLTYTKAKLNNMEDDPLLELYDSKGLDEATMARVKKLLKQRGLI